MDHDVALFQRSSEHLFYANRVGVVTTTEHQNPTGPLL
jgi:hypothetical protein